MLRLAARSHVLHFDCLSHYLVLPLSAAQLGNRRKKAKAEAKAKIG